MSRGGHPRPTTDASRRGRSARRDVLLAACTLAVGGCLRRGGIESEPLPARGDGSLLSAVESFPSEGAAHVERGTEIDYGTYPPTSGPHYAGTVAAGFYGETPPTGDVVHAPERGAVVIYYDPSALTDPARGSLRAWANNHTGHWRSVVVVPHLRADATPYVLTAWRRRLRMEAYDAEVVRAFLAEYLGRGPENAVR